LMPILQAVEPQFKNLISFYSLQTNKYENVVRLSQRSIFPIDYVPQVVMYNNGIPIAVYDGKQDAGSILRWCNLFL
jgi:thioredoxin-like negative regulator of GroEL